MAVMPLYIKDPSKIIFSSRTSGTILDIYISKLRLVFFFKTARPFSSRFCIEVIKVQGNQLYNYIMLVT